MTPAQQVRQRLLDDFGFYGPNALKIRTKDAEIVPFRMNVAQEILHAAIEKQMATVGRVRIIILKGRQMGLSTYVGGRMFFRVSQRTAKRAIVVTHEAKATETLFKMTRRFYDGLPEALKLPTKYLSQRAIDWPLPLDSSYTVGTAGSDSVGRGETITHAHLSEVAFWPASSAQDIFSGLMDAVPKKPDTEVYIESTAKGVSGVFADQWRKAVAGESEFLPIFLPWFIDAQYRVTEEDYREITRSKFIVNIEEELYSKRYGLDHDQLRFRRLKIMEKGPDLFKQEYPANPDEAFLTSGRPVFDPFLVQTLQNNRPEPVSQMAVEFAAVDNVKTAVIAPHSRGELLIYRPIEAGEQYFIGADVAQGVNGDFSVASVMDSQRRQVAVWRGQIDPNAFAYVLAVLGNHYHRAMLIVESNNHGLSTLYALSKYILYPNIFQEIVIDKVTDKETLRLGFSTNQKSKAVIVDKLRADMRKAEVEIYDKQTLGEMAAYIVTETGKMEADTGMHDDTVIALALSNHVVERRWVPITNEDDWFVQFVE